MLRTWASCCAHPVIFFFVLVSFRLGFYKIGSSA